MAMYEIVFRRLGGDDDVVLTNTDPRGPREVERLQGFPGERRVTIQGERWDIVKAESGGVGIEARLTVAAVPLHT